MGSPTWTLSPGFHPGGEQICPPPSCKPNKPPAATWSHNMTQEPPTNTQRTRAPRSAEVKKREQEVTWHKRPACHPWKFQGGIVHTNTNLPLLHSRKRGEQSPYSANRTGDPTCCPNDAVDPGEMRLGEGQACEARHGVARACEALCSLWLFPLQAKPWASRRAILHLPKALCIPSAVSDDSFINDWCLGR